MTEQERQLISGLAARVQNAPDQHMDKEADDLIRRTIGARPDALYILTQTVLLQEMALNQAKAQMDDLQQRLASQQQTTPGGGFLRPSPTPPAGGAADWGRDGRVQQQAPPAYQQPQYQQPPYPPQYPPGYGMPQQGGGFGAFLHNAASTLAGVMAGEIAFSSLSGLFGHRGGFFGGEMYGGGVSPGSETVINNYYGNEGAAGSDSASTGDSRFADAANQSGDDMSADIDDERGGGGSNFLGDDSGGQADAFDDSSSFDDGGGSDDGSSF